MSIIKRKKRNTPFVQIDKRALQNQSLSWKAKGLLAYLLSLPDDWQIYVSELQKHSKDGRDSTRSALNDLIEAGYVTREKKRDEGKFKGYEYTVSDLPYSENPKTDKPKTENPQLIIEEDNNKKEYNNNTLNSAKAKDTTSEIEILKKELSSLKTELEKEKEKSSAKKEKENHVFPDITPQKQYKVKRFNPCLTSATGGKEINKKWKTIEALKEDYESSRGIEIDAGLVEAAKKSFIETGFNYHKGINTLHKLEDALFRWIDKQKKGLNQEEKPTSSSDVFCTYSPELDAQLRKEFEEMYGINKPQNNES